MLIGPVPWLGLGPRNCPHKGINAGDKQPLPVPRGGVPVAQTVSVSNSDLCTGLNDTPTGTRSPTSSQILGVAPVLRPMYCLTVSGPASSLSLGFPLHAQRPLCGS